MQFQADILGIAVEGAAEGLGAGPTTPGRLIMGTHEISALVADSYGYRGGTTYTFEQLSAVRRYQGNIVFSPDQTEAAYITNTSGQFNIWRQFICATASGQVRRLTWSPSPRLTGRFPDGFTARAG